METIAAIATPLVKSALGIIRVSGDDSFNIVQKVFDHDLLKEKSRRIIVGKIINPKKKKFIDEVVLLQYVSPKSYTGENMIEIISHGSILVLNDILSVLIENGARIAEKGEFSMRSVINQKMNLNKAEAINDLINCNSIEGSEIIKKSLENKQDPILLDIKNELENLIANIEVNFDYPEYKDIEIVSVKKVNKVIDNICEKIKTLIGKTSINNKIVFGVKAAIIGKTNVGKSTLINSLYGKERVITSNTPGTTRDIVSVQVNLKGIPFVFYDTAGIRKSKNKIEQKGIKMAMDLIKDVDIILYVFDYNDAKKIQLPSYLESFKSKVLYVKNKTDLSKNKNVINKNDSNVCYISAKNGILADLIDKMLLKLNLNKTIYTNSLLYNDRQIGILNSIYNNLIDIKAKCGFLSMDLISTSLNESYKKMLDLLGLTFDEELNKNIFKNFCVGK